MQSPVRKIERLLGSLESLLQPQLHLLATEDFAPLLELQAQAQPVLAQLMKLLENPSVRAALPASVRQRGAALAAKQNEVAEIMQSTQASLRYQLSSVLSLQSRLSRYRSAYGASSPRARPRALAEA